MHTEICKFVKHERFNDEGQLRLENFLVIVAFNFHYFHVNKMNLAHNKAVVVVRKHLCTNIYTRYVFFVKCQINIKVEDFFPELLRRKLPNFL